MRNGLRLAVLGCVASVVLPAPAWAYLDPGSSSMIVQIVLGGVAGLVVLAKLYWRRLLVFLRLRSPDAEIKAPDERSPSDP